ncbi:MAG: PIN domain-containing protein [Sphingomonas sp.]
MVSRTTVQELFYRFDVLDVDERIAGAAVDIRHRTRIKLFDALILATAQVHGAVLIRRNVKDFPAPMPGIRIPYSL